MELLIKPFVWLAVALGLYTPVVDGTDASFNDWSESPEDRRLRFSAFERKVKTIQGNVAAEKETC